MAATKKSLGMVPTTDSRFSPFLNSTTIGTALIPYSSATRGSCSTLTSTRSSCPG
ncbi:hypothetical protein HanXRQr2_Chr16g0752571 [Helianthus annuus]|uniref:Uncharacterized protein n=1 Tax=Helianthus annuus TaxID=4232 RepID=A0A9K3H0K4_HELAN|nr:hypothetical protein HanXRQr2_Chr16g0752571 [Helianthus annuus]KAJ0821532.1 hypothetical protein HanPSC8_Chr16g0721331 [Helianthus annuus]